MPTPLTQREIDKARSLVEKMHITPTVSLVASIAISEMARLMCKDNKDSDRETMFADIRDRYVKLSIERKVIPPMPIDFDWD